MMSDFNQIEARVTAPQNLKLQGLVFVMVVFLFLNWICTSMWKVYTSPFFSPTRVYGSIYAKPRELILTCCIVHWLSNQSKAVR